MWKLFNWFKESLPTAIETPKKGEKWVLKGSYDDPFPKKGRNPIEILDIKEGWVRYYMSNFFPDNRMDMKNFLYSYTKYED